MSSAEDLFDLEKIKESNREDMVAHINKLKRVLIELESADPKDDDKIAQVKAALEAGKSLGINGGKRISRKRKSRKSRKGRKGKKRKTSKKRRH